MKVDIIIDSMYRTLALAKLSLFIVDAATRSVEDNEGLDGAILDHFTSIATLDTLYVTSLSYTV